MSAYDLHPLSDKEKRRILAGYVRNNIGTATIFSPWHELELVYLDGILCRVRGKVTGAQPICTVGDIMALDDDAIYALIVEGKGIEGMTDEQNKT